MIPNSSADLQEFIRVAKEHGAGDESLVGILENAGWSKNLIFQALGERYESLTGIRIPLGKKTTTKAKDAFLYWLSMVLLITWTFALGAVCYLLIGEWFPDPLAQNILGLILEHEISGHLATLVVTYPVCLFVMWIIIAETKRFPEKLESAIRKWLLYLVLLLAALVMIGDVAVLLTYFLQGDLTSRFIAKVIVTLLIPGGFLALLRLVARGAARSERCELVVTALPRVWRRPWWCYSWSWVSSERTGRGHSGS